MRFQTVKDEDSSPDWERIKSFVGGANKASKHPLDQEMERLKMRQPEHMEKGGEAGFDIGGAGSDTLRMLGIVPQKQSIIPSNENVQVQPSPLAQGSAFMPDMSSGMDQTLAQIPPAGGSSANENERARILARLSQTGENPTSSVPKVSGGQRGNASSGLQKTPSSDMALSPMPSDSSYDNQASQRLGGINPQELKSFLEKVNQPTLRDNLGRGVAGFSDALMQGVAQQGPGHALESVDKQIQQNKENLSGIPSKVAEAGKEQYGLSQSLQAKDPNSLFSKVTQNANRQLLKSMGASDEDISRMPATSINDVVGHQVTLQDALARIKEESRMKEIGFGLQKEQIEATKSNQSAEQENKREERQQANEKLKLEHPIMNMFGKIPNVGAPASSGPLGPTTTRNGKVYEWSPVSGKYHPQGE